MTEGLCSHSRHVGVLSLEKRDQERQRAGDASDGRVVDSARARAINNQMDWECSGCGMVNFAKYISCKGCKRQVDASTKHLNNRFKELKNERFARVFANDKSRALQTAAAVAAAAIGGNEPTGQRADGSAVFAAPNNRASFQQYAVGGDEE